MNRRMSGADRSLNVTMTDDSETEWVDRLIDERPTQEFLLAEADGISGETLTSFLIIMSAARIGLSYLISASNLILACHKLT